MSTVRQLGTVYNVGYRPNAKSVVRKQMVEISGTILDGPAIEAVLKCLASNHDADASEIHIDTLERVQDVRSFIVESQSQQAADPPAGVAQRGGANANSNRNRR